jgi:hypothetical protein
MLGNARECSGVSVVPPDPCGFRWGGPAAGRLLLGALCWLLAAGCWKRRVGRIDLCAWRGRAAGSPGPEDVRADRRQPWDVGRGTWDGVRRERGTSNGKRDHPMRYDQPRQTKVWRGWVPYRIAGALECPVGRQPAPPSRLTWRAGAAGTCHVHVPRTRLTPVSPHVLGLLAPGFPRCTVQPRAATLPANPRTVRSTHRTNRVYEHPRPSPRSAPSPSPSGTRPPAGAAPSTPVAAAPGIPRAPCRAG